MAEPVSWGGRYKEYGFDDAGTALPFAGESQAKLPTASHATSEIVPISRRLLSPDPRSRDETRPVRPRIRLQGCRRRPTLCLPHGWRRYETTTVVREYCL